MHRGTIFIINKNKNNEFEVQKSTEFNGEMGLDNNGKDIYNMLKDFKEPLLFDTMIRKFNELHFKYDDNIMIYTAYSQDRPFIEENGNKYFEYSQIDNQFKFFRDDNGEYIYTSDSNYIKNISNENINIVCCNGTYTLKPNQILVTDYNRCINNTKEDSKEVQLDKLDDAEYIPTKKEKLVIENIKKTFETFGYSIDIINENGMNNGIEIETWTDGGVDMIHTIYFFADYRNIYNVDIVNREIQDMCDCFSIDDEIDIYRQDKNYKDNFSIKESLNDFEKYENRLNDLRKNFLTKYQELIYKKIINNEIEKESL